MNISKFHSILFGVILLLFYFINIQEVFTPFNLEPLKGAIKIEAKPSITKESWLNGKYQEKEDKYNNQTFGFRNWFLRLYNQVHFSIFKIPNAKNVIIGKNNYLYEEGYLLAAYGHDYIGYDSINRILKQIKLVGDTLKKLNVDLLSIYAPGKGSFYKEFIPNRYVQEDYKLNHPVYKKITLDYGLNHIDFYEFFMQAKDTSRYSLFPKTGIHWSYYGEVIVADSIIKYIQKLRNIKTPELYWDTVKVSNEMQARDDDIEKAMNLMFNIGDLEMGYPNVRIINQDSYKPKVLVLGDSYWDYISRNFTRNIFQNERYWYYNWLENPHVPYWNDKVKVWNLNLQEIVEDQEVIIMIATDANYSAFPFQFIDQLYNIYYNDSR
jgi:hypothetical protein